VDAGSFVIKKIRCGTGGRCGFQPFTKAAKAYSRFALLRALRCFSKEANPGLPWSSCATGLRRKEDFLAALFAARLRSPCSLRSRRATRSSRALTLVLRVDAESFVMKRIDVVRRTVRIPTLHKSGEGWGTHGMVVKKKREKLDGPPVEKIRQSFDRPSQISSQNDGRWARL
jgi:hypothetical protein